jgi:hypothetical protein
MYWRLTKGESMTTFVQKDGREVEINPVDSRLKVAVALENSGEQAKADAMLDKALFAEMYLIWHVVWHRRDK